MVRPSPRLVPMTTRRCSRCACEKTIRGVWYLAPATGPTAFFVCESCYVTSPGAMGMG